MPDRCPQMVRSLADVALELAHFMPGHLLPAARSLAVFDEKGFPFLHGRVQAGSGIFQEGVERVGQRLLADVRLQAALMLRDVTSLY
jgi:hypothetical protein